MLRPAHDGYPVVDDEELVVHAAVQLPEPQEELQCSPELAAADSAGIEDLQVEVRVGGDRRYAALLGGKDQVVDEEADPHPAVGRLKETVKKEQARLVPLPDEVLDVDRLRRFVDESQAPGEGLLIPLEEGEARGAGPLALGKARGELSGQTGGRRRQSGDRRHHGGKGKGRAAPEDKEGRDD